jgi:hypothetical protein
MVGDAFVGGDLVNRPELRVTATSGSLTVLAETRADVVIDGSGEVRTSADGSVDVLLRRASTSIKVRCPEGTDVVAGTRSGSLYLHGRLGDVRATTISGRVEADDVSSADLRSTSGSILVGTCAGTCRAMTKSGSVRIGSAGATEVAIGSGSVELDHVVGAVQVRAVSGSVAVAAAGAGRVEVETMSGSITIVLPADCRPDVRARSLSGRSSVELPAGFDCEVVAKTLSGGIVVRPT